MVLSYRTWVAGLKFLGLGVLCLSSAETLSQIRYDQPISQYTSYWSGSASKVSCVLSYAIDGYGRADFTMLSGPQKRLSLELFPLVGIGQKAQMRVISAPPAWRHGGEELELGRIDIFPGFNPFLGDSVSWRVLTSLDQGLEILFPFADKKRYPRDTVVPVISPMGFQQEFSKFQECSAQLLDVAYGDVAMNAYLFKENTLDLQPLSRAALDKQILYLTNDKSINNISILAFAFERGSNEANQALAMQRANFLKQEFVNAGFNADNISTQTYDDAGSSTVLKEDRVFGARAIVRLYRDDTLIDPNREALMPDIGMPGAKLP